MGNFHFGKDSKEATEDDFIFDDGEMDMLKPILNEAAPPAIAVPDGIVLPPLDSFVPKPHSGIRLIKLNCWPYSKTKVLAFREKHER